MTARSRIKVLSKRALLPITVQRSSSVTRHDARTLPRAEPECRAVPIETGARQFQNKKP